MLLNGRWRKTACHRAGRFRRCWEQLGRETACSKCSHRVATMQRDWAGHWGRAGPVGALSVRLRESSPELPEQDSILGERPVHRGSARPSLGSALVTPCASCADEAGGYFLTHGAPKPYSWPKGRSKAPTPTPPLGLSRHIGRQATRLDRQVSSVRLMQHGARATRRQVPAVAHVSAGQEGSASRSMVTP